MGIPVISFDYSLSIIPAILTVWVMSYNEWLVESKTMKVQDIMERFLRKICKNSLGAEAPGRVFSCGLCR